METSDLIARASAGDDNAFRELVEVHSHELQVHCYRILGSLQDAEDALQETLVSAWRNLGDFGQRSSLRTWLYQIATRITAVTGFHASVMPRFGLPRTLPGTD
jgi:DNA-directed RNA polymerase specialized sigma24 family protein